MADNKKHTDSLSDLSSEASNADPALDMVLEEPMYYVLSQFLLTDDQKNIATILQELVAELKDIKAVLASSKKPSVN